MGPETGRRIVKRAQKLRGRSKRPRVERKEDTQSMVVRAGLWPREIYDIRIGGEDRVDSLQNKERWTHERDSIEKLEMAIESEERFSSSIDHPYRLTLSAISSTACQIWNIHAFILPLFPALPRLIVPRMGRNQILSPASISDLSISRSSFRHYRTTSAKNIQRNQL